MIEVAVLLKNSTLAARSEHRVHTVGGMLPLNENESLDCSRPTRCALLDRARPATSGWMT